MAGFDRQCLFLLAAVCFVGIACGFAEERLGELATLLDNTSDKAMGISEARKVLVGARNFSELRVGKTSLNGKRKELLDQECLKFSAELESNKENVTGAKFAAMHFLRNLYLIERLVEYNEMPRDELDLYVSRLVSTTSAPLKSIISEYLKTLAGNTLLSTLKVPLSDEKTDALTKEIALITGHIEGPVTPVRQADAEMQIAKKCQSYWPDRIIDLSEMKERCGFSQDEYLALAKVRHEVEKRPTFELDSAMYQELMKRMPADCVNFLLANRQESGDQIQAMKQSLLNSVYGGSLKVRDQCLFLLLPVIVKAELGLLLNDNRFCNEDALRLFASATEERFVFCMPSLADGKIPLFLADLKYENLDNYILTVIDAFPRFRPLVFPLDPEGLTVKVGGGEWSVSALEGRYQKRILMKDIGDEPVFDEAGFGFNFPRLAFLHRRLVANLTAGLQVTSAGGTKAAVWLYHGVNGDRVALTHEGDIWTMCRTRIGEKVPVHERSSERNSSAVPTVTSEATLAIALIAPEGGCSVRIYDEKGRERYLVFRLGEGKRGAVFFSPEQRTQYENVVVKYWTDIAGAASDPNAEAVFRQCFAAVPSCPDLSVLPYLDRCLSISILRNDPAGIDTVVTLFAKRCVDAKLAKFQESYLRQATLRAKELRADEALRKLESHWLASLDGLDWSESSKREYMTGVGADSVIGKTVNEYLSNRNK